MHFRMQELHREAYIKLKNLTKEFLHFMEFQVHTNLKLEIMLFEINS